ncbi:MAG: hypothetical protein K2O18_10980 [Oscillospiraceae bacterium]|nr:hypothetical protein [Oscillospiraceae bacterium]
MFSQEDAYFGDISALVQEVLDKAGVSDAAVLGAGLGMQGLVPLVWSYGNTRN